MKEERSGRLEEALVLVLSFGLPLALYTEAFDVALVKSVTLHLAVAGLLLAAWARAVELGRIELPSPGMALAPAALLLFLTVLSGMLRDSAFSTADSASLWCLTLLAATGLAGLGPASRAADGLAAAGTLVGAYAVAARLGMDPLGLGPAGPLRDTELAGAFLAAAFAVSAGRGGLYLVAAAAAAAGAAASGLVGLVCLALAGVFVLAFHFRLGPIAARRAALAFLAALALSLLAFRLSDQPGQALKSLAFLRGAFSGAVSMISERPLAGWGNGRFADAFPAHRPSGFPELAGRNAWVEHPRNEPLALGCELGIAGSVLWLAWAAVLLWTGSRALKRAREEGLPGEAPLLASLGSACATLLAGALFTSSGREAAPAAQLALLGGLLAGLSLQRLSNGKVFALPLPVPMPWRRALLVPAALGLLGLAVWESRLMGSDIFHNLAVFKARKGDWQEALAFSESVAPSSPRTLAAQYLKANVYLERGERGDPDRAAAQFELVQSLSPDYALAHYRKGLALARSGEWRLAIEEHRRQSELDPSFAENWRELAAALDTQGEKEEALSAGLRYLALRPDLPEPWKDLAARYRAQGNRQAARRIFERAERVRAVALK